jgi:Txe/YoeB family toxin of Txe-Axe toxin-antitoxin module
MYLTKIQLIGLCDKLITIAREQRLPETFMQNIAGLQQEMEGRQLVVPVVGAFSAGKSTLINNCIGANILPVAVTPETSLATELHYAGEERVEAVKKDGSVTRYTVNEMEKLKNDAPQYVYARLFLKSPALREIEPLVLVDMPGFDSPLDSHNKAILEYLDRGCYYIVLSSGAEEKTLSASLIRRLREIKALERGISFFVSKTNMLASQNEIDELVEHYHSGLKNNLDDDMPVRPLGDVSGGEVVNVLKAIDTDRLFFNIYQRRLKSLCYELVELLNIRISALKKDGEENLRLIAEMENSIHKIEQKAESLVADIQERYSRLAVNDLVSSVGKALDASTDELVSVGMSGDREKTERLLNDIVRVSLTSAIKTKLGSLINEITMDLSSELSGLDSMMGSYDGSINYVDAFAQKAQALLNDLQITDGKDGIGKKETALMGGYTAIMGIVSLISGGVITIMEAVIMFLPELLSPVIEIFKKKKHEKELRTKFQVEIFPAIKQKIRSDMPGFLNDAVEKIIIQVRDQYSQRIKQQRQEIDASIESAKAGAEEKQRQQEILSAALQDAKKIADSLQEEAV